MTVSPHLNVSPVTSCVEWNTQLNLLTCCRIPRTTWIAALFRRTQLRHPCFWAWSSKFCKKCCTARRSNTPIYITFKFVQRPRQQPALSLTQTARIRLTPSSAWRLIYLLISTLRWISPGRKTGCRYHLPNRSPLRRGTQEHASCVTSPRFDVMPSLDLLVKTVLREA